MLSDLLTSRVGVNGDDIGIKALQRQVLRPVAVLHDSASLHVAGQYAATRHDMCANPVLHAAALLSDSNMWCADVKAHAHIDVGISVVVSALDCWIGNDFVS